MIGHCGGLRPTQKIGDFVLAHAYLRDDHVLDAVAAFPFDVVVCVLRPGSRVEDHLTGRGVTPVVNTDADLGMGTSLAAGIRALPPVDAAFVVLADMPGLPRELFGPMVTVMEASKAEIVVPLHDGRQGHPVLFSSRCFPDLMALQGDVGAKSLIRSGAYAVTEVDTGSAGILRDVDLPDDLNTFR